MSSLDQMRGGVEKLIAIDSGIGVITRPVKADNGLGQPVPTGELETRKVICRVSYQSGGVWSSGQWEGGLTVDTSPFVLARHDADIEQGDGLEWRGRKYSVGVVTRPETGGGFVLTQAPLTEVK